MNKLFWILESCRFSARPHCNVISQTSRSELECRQPPQRTVSLYLRASTIQATANLDPATDPFQFPYDPPSFHTLSQQHPPKLVREAHIDCRPSVGHVRHSGESVEFRHEHKCENVFALDELVTREASA
jgi:hypothetical protein